MARGSKDATKRLLKLLNASIQSVSKPNEVNIPDDESSAELVWFLTDEDGDRTGEFVMELLPGENTIRVTVWPSDKMANKGAEPIELAITTKK
jgi:hypothetical protein